VYAKPMKMKRVSSDEKIKPGLDEQLQLYSKVDKSRKRVGDDQLSGTPDDLPVPAQHTVSPDTPEINSSHILTVPHEADSAVSDGAYEPINLSGPPKADGDYDTVVGDYGYDSVDIVTEKGRDGRLPTLATLKRAPEHIYDVVPEVPSDVTLPSDDYDHIVEIPTEKV